MRILIVEDEEKLANNLKKALETESYAVDVASDGEQGLEEATVNDYDVIILDIGLPLMNGLELSKKLRKEKIKSPILMLTARDTTPDKIKGLDSGADDYLVKPFQFEELLARIRALTRRLHNTTNPIITIDSLELDPSSKLVKRAGKEVTLSAKEYALLEFLAHNAKRIISKSQLIEHVWDNEIDPFSNVVDVYIGYVRGKIDKAFPKEKPLLSTVKGLGYRLGK